jgi:hypothetical protein
MDSSFSKFLKAQLIFELIVRAIFMCNTNIPESTR